jgi:hypothetical protein
MRTRARMRRSCACIMLTAQGLKGAACASDSGRWRGACAREQPGRRRRRACASMPIAACGVVMTRSGTATASSCRAALIAKHAITAPIWPAPARSAGACAVRRIQLCTGRFHVRQKWLTVDASHHACAPAPQLSMCTGRFQVRQIWLSVAALHHSCPPHSSPAHRPQQHG